MNFQTPYYWYDLTLLDKTLNVLSKTAESYGYKIHYAVKANNNERILRRIAHEGYGADCVSGNEVLLAMKCGFHASKIFFAGVGKTDDEIITALQHGIGALVVESIEELEVISELTQRLQQQANIILRINPEVDAHTHGNITTGLKENKFGISESRIFEALSIMRQSSERLLFRGIHFHIGSQMMDFDPMRELCIKVNAIRDAIVSEGFYPRIIDLGGGLGIDYDCPEGQPIPDFVNWCQAIYDTLRLESGEEVHLEPGRSIVGQCGMLISKVLYVKQGEEKKFVILDAGMTELIRPALYGAKHVVRKIKRMGENNRPVFESASISDNAELYDVVGPICESSDTFAKNLPLPPMRRNDLVAILSAGAYGEVMSSEYNGHTKPRVFYSDMKLSDDEH